MGEARGRVRGGGEGAEPGQARRDSPSTSIARVGGPGQARCGSAPSGQSAPCSIDKRLAAAAGSSRSMAGHKDPARSTKQHARQYSMHTRHSMTQHDIA